MIRNYIKTAWRSIQKNKLYTLINLVGLTTGIVSCLLIGLYIWNELNFDKFHTKADRIAKVYMDYQVSGTGSKIDVTGNKVGPQFQRVFPQVEDYVRTMKHTGSFTYEDQTFEEYGVLYADDSFFSVFTFPLLQGNPQTALSEPYSVVLTSQTAKKYFGETDPIGQTLYLNGGEQPYAITGVVEVPPINSQIQYDVLLSMNSIPNMHDEYWVMANYHTYLLMHQPSDLNTLESSIQQYMKEVSDTEMGMSGNDYWTYYLEPLIGQHLNSEVSNSFESNGNMVYIYVLAVIAGLILLIACVNYINMATAQSVRRSTEIGVRKVMGAGKKQLIGQFLGESMILSLLAAGLGLLLSFALLPIFNSLTERSFTFYHLIQPQVVGGLLLLTIFIAILAGSYPALVLSRTNLAAILKSGVRVSNSGGLLRKSLITFQFSIAIFLLAATLIVGQQLSFIQQKNMGYDRDQVVVLPVDSKTRTQYSRLKSAFENISGVQHVTGAYEDPTSIGWGDGISADNGSGGGPKQLSLHASPVDLDYLETMGMELVAGRDFLESDLALQITDNDYRDYRATFILNEKAVHDLGWTTEEAVGKTITRGVPGTVVGVVKDFHFESLHTPIGPLLIFLDQSSIRQMFVKIDGDRTAETLKAMESVWQARIGHRPFDYHFMDEDFNALYQSEQRIGNLFTLFASIAIILACLGLFALAAFTTIQRTKEIGIRKILGANAAGITFMFSAQFLKLVCMAILIGSPLAWWAGSHWLQNYAYRIDINWWVFGIAGIAAIIIAMISVGYHVLRAALANPIHALRDE